MTVPLLLLLQPDPMLLRSLVQVPPMFSLEMLRGRAGGMVQPQSL